MSVRKGLTTATTWETAIFVVIFRDLSGVRRRDAIWENSLGMAAFVPDYPVPLDLNQDPRGYVLTGMNAAQKTPAQWANGVSTL